MDLFNNRDETVTQSVAVRCERYHKGVSVNREVDFLSKTWWYWPLKYSRISINFQADS